jgi:hypothetical protein
MSPDHKATEELRAYLLTTYGPLVARPALIKVLGFSSGAAFDRSVQQGRLHLKLSRLEGRRGVFALSTDVADYLIQVFDKGRLAPREKERDDQR